MTTQVRALLYYLGRYLKAHPEKRAELVKAYKKTIRVKSAWPAIWRHTMLKVEPSASSLLVYLAFLYREQAIEPGKRGEGLFIYSFPEFLRRRK